MSAAVENEAAWALALQKLHAEVGGAESKVSEARDARDCRIRALISEGRSMYAIAKVLGISQQSVRQIRDAGR